MPFGEQLVVQMRYLIADIEHVLIGREERSVAGTTSRSQSAPSTSLIESISMPSISAKVLKNDSWPVRAEAYMETPSPLAEAFTGLEHRYESEDPPKKWKIFTHLER